MTSFQKININGLPGSPETGQARLMTLGRGQAAGPDGLLQMKARLSRSSDEAASRFMLQTYLEDVGSESLLAVTAPQKAEVMPDMRMMNISAAPLLDANSVAYQQTAQAIPIFGGRVVVDVDSADKSLVAINGKVAPPPDIDPVASISPKAAWGKLLGWAKASGSQLMQTPPVLTWYLDEDNSNWHLVYHFASVRLEPPAEQLPQGLHPQQHACVRCAPNARSPFYDYFVDAHDGIVPFYFSSSPALDIPTPMSGIDCYNVAQNFFGALGAPGVYFLKDPLRNIETYDYLYGDMDLNPPFPAQPISHNSANLGNVSPQAVSAHYHAKVVFDFYNDELKRDGIDDKGMKLVSVVNVYSSTQNTLPRPQWGNAVWWQGKMWYGEENGQSFAKYLDVIAHELTHGVTASSSNLIYRRLPGALNESYSDIFGVIVANWYPGAPNPVANWNWQIGLGLGQGGGPIRDFANPAATGQPDHMNQYQVMPISYDNGGVHIYSGIHNRAIYKLLTSVDAAGDLTFPTKELVLLLYLTLTRLTPTSDFLDSRRTLENVTRVYHASNPLAQSARLTAIAASFSAVGIL